MKACDKRYINKFVDSVIDLHIQKNPYNANSSIRGKFDLNELRLRITKEFRNSICDELNAIGFQTTYDNKSNVVDFSASSVESIVLSPEQRKKVTHWLEMHR